MSGPAVQLRGFSKTFGTQTVLHDVDLDVAAGEIVGVVGQNGCGKSTLIKLLAGYHDPDPGAELRVAGVEERLPLSLASRKRLGLAFVHQDLGLVADATVVENMRIGRYRSSLGWRVSWRREERLCLEALERFHVDVRPGALVSSLREVDRAMVAIVRALDELEEGRHRLLVLDEPTSYLPRQDVAKLFETVRSVAAAGVGVIFVSHRLEEILELSDRVVALREGRIVAEMERAALTEEALVAQIVGAPLSRLYPDEPHEPSSERVLAVRELAGAGLRPMSFDLHAGEILGLTGLVGMGHTDVPYLLFGARPAAGGTLAIGDARLAAARVTPRQAMAHGLALVPADRAHDGSWGSATVRENITLPGLRCYFRSGRLRRARELRRTTELVHAYDVRPADTERAFAALSGGNQQKALLAKWIELAPRVLLLDEPCQGVDIGARARIFRVMREIADEGTAVVVASVEAEDLAHMCDRVLVFRDGAVAEELSGASLTVNRIVEGAHSARPAGAVATTSTTNA